MLLASSFSLCVCLLPLLFACPSFRGVTPFSFDREWRRLLTSRAVMELREQPTEARAPDEEAHNPLSYQEEEGGGGGYQVLARDMVVPTEEEEEEEGSRHLLWRGGDEDRYNRRYAPISQDVPRANYNRGNARMGAWALLSLAGWGWTRIVCVVATLPDDCVKHASVLDTLSDVQLMLTFSFVQGWFTEITQPRRYHYVFSRWYFFVLYFLSGTAFSIISSVPALESSLSSGSHYTAPQVLVYLLLGALIIGVIAFHFYHAWQVYPPRNFFTYVGARLAVLLFYLVYAIVGTREEGDSLHLHHYFLAWSVSLLAQFQHPISITFLATTAGIFVQGIGAYHAASLFDVSQPFAPCWPPYYPDLPQEGNSYNATGGGTA